MKKKQERIDKARDRSRSTPTIDSRARSGEPVIFRNRGYSGFQWGLGPTLRRAIASIRRAYRKSERDPLIGNLSEATWSSFSPVKGSRRSTSASSSATRRPDGAMPLVWSLPTSRGDRLAIVRLGDGVCLWVADELVLLRDPSTGQKLDQVAVIWVGTNFFRQERPATPDIWIRTPGPDIDSRSLPADLL